MRWQLFLIFLISIFLLLIFLGYDMNAYANAGSIGINQITVSEKDVKLYGTLFKSSAIFKGFDYKIVNENLYVKVRIGLIKFYNSSASGNIRIKIKNDNIKSIKRIYIQGKKDNDKKLIWQRP